LTHVASLSSTQAPSPAAAFRILLGPSLNVRSWDKAAALLFGLSTQDAVGKPLAGLLHLPRARVMAGAQAAALRAGPSEEDAVPCGVGPTALDLWFLPVEDGTLIVGAPAGQPAASEARHQVEESQARLDNLREESRVLAEEVVAKSREVVAGGNQLAQLEEEGRVLEEALNQSEGLNVGLVHDMGNLLAAVNMNVELLQSEHELPKALEKRQASLTALVRRSTKLLARSARLRALNRAVSAPATTEVTPMLREAIATVRDMYPWRAVAFMEELGPRDLKVLAAPGIEDAVLNIVMNAIKHNPSPTPHVWVSVHALPSGMVEIRFEDDGPGMPPEVLDITKPSKSLADEHGWGLRLARRIIERSGGRLDLVPGDPDDERTGAILRLTLRNADAPGSSDATDA
jgi:signal transduction histidine kinase